jgi:hypothetical protein
MTVISETLDERIDRIERQLDELLQEITELRKEHLSQHNDLLKVLAHQEMRIAVLRHRN